MNPVSQRSSNAGHSASSSVRRVAATIAIASGLLWPSTNYAKGSGGPATSQLGTASVAARLADNSAAFAAPLWAARHDARASEYSSVPLSLPTPSSVFLQAGVAEKQTTAFLAGATWDLPWQKELSYGSLGAYFEASVGRWATEAGEGGSALVTQVGVTPVVRLSPYAWSNTWFVEVGIGANAILPVYHSREKQFSTEFNFGDHAAVGRRFGQAKTQELAVRVQHFSNGGIDHPNPGENFLQLRYSIRL